VADFAQTFDILHTAPAQLGMIRIGANIVTMMPAANALGLVGCDDLQF
jgi:hypothetical protein